MATDWLTRFQLLSEAPKGTRQQFSSSIETELAALCSDDLMGVLCLCENVLESPATAKTANRLLLRVCEVRRDLCAAKLLRGGASLPMLLRLAQCGSLGDVPPGAELANELLAVLLGWQPTREAVAKQGVNIPASLVVLGAVRHFGLVSHLSEEAVQLVFEHAVAVEGGRLSARLAHEAGDLLPGVRPLILELLLASETLGAQPPALGLREVVRLAQRWRLHQDPAIFTKLKVALNSSPEADGERAPERCGTPSAPTESEALLPKLGLSGERVVLVDGSASVEEDFVQTVAAAMSALRSGGAVRVAVDAEWEDPRPLSLLQLAIQHVGDGGSDEVSVFLVDFVATQPERVLQSCRDLLRPAASTLHEVLAFGAHEDKRRLVAAGLLPELAPRSDGAAEGDVVGWVDLQGVFASSVCQQPGLRTVVAEHMGAYLDKTLQKSDWDRRPLTQEQRAYAALDASILLRLRQLRPELRAVCGVLRAAKSASDGGRGSGGKSADACGDRVLSLDEERARWSAWLEPRKCSTSPATASEGGCASEPEASLRNKREVNGHLRFVLPAALSKLMRKLRGLGVDTVVMPEGAPVQELAAAACAEDRIILTQSRKLNLPARARDRAYWLRESSADEQLREVIGVFGVEVDPDCLCGRCVQCNAWDWRFASREDVRDNPQLSQGTLNAYEEFWVCGGCGKVFWEGGMFEKAVSHFRTFLPDSEYQPPSDADGSVSGGGDGSGLFSGSSDRGSSEVDKYREMEERGCSVQRIRAQMIRDGVADNVGYPPAVAALANTRSSTASVPVVGDT